MPDNAPAVGSSHADAEGEIRSRRHRHPPLAHPPGVAYVAAAPVYVVEPQCYLDARQTRVGRLSLCPHPARVRAAREHLARSSFCQLT
jgi:hypothetical protein